MINYQPIINTKYFCKDQLHIMLMRLQIEINTTGLLKVIYKGLKPNDHNLVHSY